MGIAIWNDSYLTGDATVDLQHRNLFKMVNELHDAVVASKGKEVLQATLKKLGAYTIEHFGIEERLMQRAEYPGYEGHKAKHELLANQARQLIADYETGKAVLSITLSHFLADWLRHHINEEDKGMITWLRGRTTKV